MKMIIAIALSFFAWLVIGGTLAHAQQGNCNSYQVVSGMLSGKHGEQRIGGGLVGNTKLEMWMNPKTRKWTLVQRMGNTACVMTAGQHWKFKIEELKKLKKPKGSAS